MDRITLAPMLIVGLRIASLILNFAIMIQLHVWLHMIFGVLLLVHWMSLELV
jgi:hypothetical protein